MCPVCLATLGLWIGAIGSAGAGTAYLFKRKRKEKESQRWKRNQSISARMSK